MKFGIDIHKTIDAKPKFFAKFSQRARANGHTIVIITGSQKTPEIEKQIKDLGIEYDEFFSVTDYLIKSGVMVFWKDRNNPWFEDEYWNTVKADYCKQHGINLHFDDSDEYCKHFTTTYVKVI